jgi:hypothetical protein
MPTTIATLMVHAEHVRPMLSAMHLMVDPSHINHAAIKPQEPVRDVDPTLTALLLLPTVELMAFATIAVHLIATMLAVPVLMDPHKQLNLTKIAIPFPEFALTSVPRMMTVKIHASLIAKLNEVAALNV